MDGAGAAVLGAITFSSDIPVTPGTYDTTWHTNGKAIVAKFDMLPTGVTRFGSSTAGCDGPLPSSVTAMPYAGNPQFGLICLDAPALTVGFLGVSVAPLATPLLAYGAAVWIDPTSWILVPILSSDVGAVYASTPLTAPVVAPGLAAYTQFFWPDGCALGGWSSSYALEIVIQP